MIKVYLNDINYIAKSNNGSIIYFNNGQKMNINTFPTQFVESLKTHFQKIEIPYAQKYKLPYCFQELILQPTKSPKYKDCEYINLLSIIDIIKYQYGCQVKFLYHTIYIDLTPQQIYHYLNLNVSYKIRINSYLLSI